MQQPSRATSGLEEIQALLGAGTRFSGTLAFEGAVRVDGTLEGVVHGDGVLIVGPGADLRAEVDVGTLIVRGGVVRGNCVARQLIEVHAEGTVFGDLKAPEIDIAKGSVVEGRCTVIAPMPDEGDADDR